MDGVVGGGQENGNLGGISRIIVKHRERRCAAIIINAIR